MKPKDNDDKRAVCAACAEQSGDEERGERQNAAKKNKRKRTVRTAVLSVTVALAVGGAIAGLSVALVYSEGMNDLRAEYMRDMEGVYTRHYYDLADSANELTSTWANSPPQIPLRRSRTSSTTYGARQVLPASASPPSAAERKASCRRANSSADRDNAHYLAKRLDDAVRFPQRSCRNSANCAR